ncbi:hypothetical protein SAMN05421776_101822 [Nocardia farcinica]|uniref:ABC-type bacteriocin/lantibiotic exporters, contain an N-terminal double-glycine peptidase domain n=1 Tax=Nocardia farcinica TaxID=37329 RepID=A0A0H5NL27_NOCFR|nr:ABC-type bacteriocin/lantibiotic exporters%2C contain an N-terminal double-glycine peptidase domain [Nocardia farcinica]SIS71695.1 hypothetical protein SAMN05421776_101822 [Nocardia farcinica]
MRGAGALMSPVQRGVVLAGLGAARSRVAAFVAVTALGSTCAIASPLILAGIVQRPDRPATTVAAALAAYAVAVAAARFLYDVRMVLANAVEQRVATTADGTVLRSLLGADGSLAVANNPARIASVVASFHRSNKMLVQILLMAFLGGLFDVALSFLVIGGYVDWTIGAAVVGYGAASVWLTLRANKVTSAYLKRAQHNSDEASNLLGNVLTNLVSLRVFRGIDWVVAANDRYFRRSRQGWTDFYRKARHRRRSPRGIARGGVGRVAGRARRWLGLPHRGTREPAQRRRTPTPGAGPRPDRRTPAAPAGRAEFGARRINRAQHLRAPARRGPGDDHRRGHPSHRARPRRRPRHPLRRAGGRTGTAAVTSVLLRASRAAAARARCARGNERRGTGRRGRCCGGGAAPSRHARRR